LPQIQPKTPSSPFNFGGSIHETALLFSMIFSCINLSSYFQTGIAWERGRLARKQAVRLHQTTEAQAMLKFCAVQFALPANAGEPPALPECLSETIRHQG